MSTIDTLKVLFVAIYKIDLFRERDLCWNVASSLTSLFF